MGLWRRPNSRFQLRGVYNAIEDAITQYLTSVGIPAAMELLKDYEQRGWHNV